nr:hypothetical protein B0A51_09421 [Rachicladosporium sp. CCFEE 5018]
MVLNVGKPQDPAGLTIEAWAQGFMVGSLMVMACITFANMRRGVLLHKLILTELVLGMFHGTFIFTNPPVYNWYLSVTAVLLNISWSLHNVIAWIKVKPFLPRWGSILFISSLALVQPYWVLEITANFLYFSGKSALFTHTRPYEALFRDPWWIFTVLSLFYNIKSRYEFGYIELMRVSPRFAVLLGAMLLSIGFLVVDILSVTNAIKATALPDGIQPFWKMAFVWRCVCDSIVLDDFATALGRLKAYKLQRLGSVMSEGVRGEFSFDDQVRRKKELAPSPLDISKPEEFVRLDEHGQYPPLTRDWSRPTNGTSGMLDLEAALRDVEPDDDSPKRHARTG